MSSTFQFKDSTDWANMTDGYPNLDTQDSTLLTARFPRFTDKILYDTTAAGEDSESDDTHKRGHASVRLPGVLRM